MYNKINKLKRLSKILSAISAICAVLAATALFYGIMQGYYDNMNLIKSNKSIIDSLNMEIQLRDNIINQTKDTIYGEETKQSKS